LDFDAFSQKSGNGTAKTSTAPGGIKGVRSIKAGFYTSRRAFRAKLRGNEVLGQTGGTANIIAVLKISASLLPNFIATLPDNVTIFAICLETSGVSLATLVNKVAISPP
jgi:hypothetical protein